MTASPGRAPGRALCARCGAALLLLAAPGAVAALVVDEHPRLVTLVERMVAAHDFTRDELVATFAGVELRPSVVARIRRPAESLPWHKYRKIFLNEGTIMNGARFRHEHAATLERMRDRYGVPPAIVAAIIGVETRYGAVKGANPVLDSLVTLVLQYPRRSDFFASELEHFLLLCREESLDPSALRGSYAGAMGIPQFISSSYRNYAVDFNGDGVRDLLHQVEDAIGSVGNYLGRHRWQAGQPVAARARIDGAALGPGEGLEPQLRLADLYDAGLRLDAAAEIATEADPALPAMLIELATEDGSEHWVGFGNFFVITRYNHSKLYAMAVHQLSRAIRDEYRRRFAGAPSPSSSSSSE